MDQTNYESIMDKLRKLRVLAERGEAGEARNAKAAIDRICSQYGIKFEDLASDKKKRRRFVIGKSKLYKRLFWQCYSYILNDNSPVSYWRPKRDIIDVELTDLQFADLSAYFYWHLANFDTELAKAQEIALSAYIQKHDIYSDESRKPDGKPLTEADIKRIIAIHAAAEQMDDNYYQKQIEAL